jgi:gamma-D-glutamyl-L-lysine dipeptidyl-peptidase
MTEAGGGHLHRLILCVTVSQMTSSKTRELLFFVEDLAELVLNCFMAVKTVVVPVADMRREPNHHSERLSQALYGFTVEVKDARNQFDLVETPDGYEGWVAQSYLQEPEELDPFQTVVSSRWALFAFEGGGELVLPFGSLVRADGDHEMYRDFRSSQHMVLAAGSVDELVSRPELAPETVALSLISSPYLWGGTSPYGYDCSGLVQAVFRRCGIDLPRDSKDQSTRGQQIGLPDARAGDLIFFPGHVALCLDDLRIIHATRLRGMVLIESLNSGASDYRSDLVDKISCVRRPQESVSNV